MGEDGSTERQNLELASRLLRRRADRLQRRCPPATRYVWDWFLLLHSRRQTGDSGPNPLTFVEIDAWSRALRVTPTSAELELIMALDDAYLAFKSETARGQ